MSEQLRSVEGVTKPDASLERLAAERLKTLENGPEQQRSRIERVSEAREQLQRTEVATPAPEVAQPVAEPAYRGVLTKAANYRHTMVSLQHRMQPRARAFSKFIHQPVVENLSATAEKTVFRPSVTLGATTGAFLFTGFLYIYSRQHGLVMRGSEIWISLLGGALIGIIIEFIHNATKRR